MLPLKCAVESFLNSKLFKLKYSLRKAQYRLLNAKQCMEIGSTEDICIK